MNDVNTVTIIRNTVRFFSNEMYNLEQVHCSQDSNKINSLFLHKYQCQNITQFDEYCTICCNAVKNDIYVHET